MAERHQRLTASQEEEAERLQKLSADWDRRLTSGFYPTPYVEQGTPLTPGVATRPEVQQPEVRLYNQHGNALKVKG